MIHFILLFTILFIPYELKHQNKVMHKFVIPYELVTITTYAPSINECDSEPLITANGFKIDSLNPARHKIIAVSRDLKRKYKFGTKLKIIGTGIYDGIYTIKDVMNKRFKNTIDILVGKNDKQTKFNKIKVYKL